MHTLLIDNCGSFTYNLCEYLTACNSQPPRVIRNDELTWTEIEALSFDNIVISPGPGRPQRPADVGVTMQALRHASVPVLGVCLGHQAIAYHCGAVVGRAVRPMHGRIDQIQHSGSALFRGIPAGFDAVRHHSLAVTRLPEELEALAWASDGTLMALQHRSKPWWGVQFHPESIGTAYGARLLRNFRELSEQWHAGQGLRGPSGATKSSVARSRDARAAARATVQAVCVQTCPDMEAVFSKAFGASERCFWLDSSAADAGAARFSYMGSAEGPQAETATYCSLTGQLDIRRGDRTESRTQSIFTYLKERTDRAPPSGPALPFDFVGGYIGYFGYELKGELGGDHAHDACTPDALWMRIDRFLAFDHAEQQTWIVCVNDGLSAADDQAWTEAMRHLLMQPGPTPPVAQDEARIGLNWRTPLPAYRDQVLRCQQQILDGESHQLCLANQLSGQGDLADLDVYLQLRRRHPAPYAAFLRSARLSVLCASPELFLQISPGGVVDSKPIRGSARRGMTAKEDLALAGALATDEKLRAENLVIVDLLRNDLHRVCKAGSVHVPRLFHVETNATAHQLVSTIRGELRPEVSAVDCVRATFPGGSVTGAPKLRAMTMLDEVEGAARGVYTGSIGYLSLSGSARLNIANKAIVRVNDMVSIGSDAVITALSDPDAELDALVLKADAQRAVLEPAAPQAPAAGLRMANYG